MTVESEFVAAENLHWTAQLSWAADCVEHLCESVGDTPGGHVAASVALARKYAQSREYDLERAHALEKEMKSAQRKGSVTAEGLLSAFMSFVTFDALADTLGTRKARERDREGWTDSSYDERQGEIRAERGALLKAAEALCGVDARASAREAAERCRAGDRNEGTWQADRLSEYLHAASTSQQAQQTGS
ncbi:MAG TPA: hypothetical protein VMB05_11545 [Solirubrobacteraceae bacterium]|nr:hypothetical protein [Solirubrobacteraceae bacterium]